MLMFVHRKVIPPLNIGPVYTFGAPAVFAEADASVYGDQVCVEAMCCYMPMCLT